MNYSNRRVPHCMEFDSAGSAQRAQWDLNKIEITLNGTFMG